MGWQEEIARNARSYRELYDRLSRTSITEASSDGTVRVTVSADGLLTDLVLKERWHPPPLPELAAQIMDCVSRAQARIPDLVQQAIAETVGAPDAGAHLVLNDARDRFPEPPPPEPGRFREPVEELRIEPEPGPQPRLPAPRPNSGPASAEPECADDWDERPVLEDI